MYIVGASTEGVSGRNQQSAAIDDGLDFLDPVGCAEDLERVVRVVPAEHLPTQFGGNNREYFPSSPEKEQSEKAESSVPVSSANSSTAEDFQDALQDEPPDDAVSSVVSE